MVLLATSCLQGRPLADAVFALAGLGADGLQFTPGNLPSPGMEALVPAFAFPVRYHHGFDWNRRRAEVYAGEEARLGGPGWSIHPPETVSNRVTWLEGALARGIPLEIMPEGFLGCGEDVRLAMDVGVRLAVDIAHLWIQKVQGRIDAGTIRRLLEYDRIEEIHVSGNDGRYDAHTPVRRDAPWLDWARQRRVPVVLECYMHRLEFEERVGQVDVVRG